jgi:hypothetical protein
MINAIRTKDLEQAIKKFPIIENSKILEKYYPQYVALVNEDGTIIPKGIIVIATYKHHDNTAHKIPFFWKKNSNGNYQFIGNSLN